MFHTTTEREKIHKTEREEEGDIFIRMCGSHVK